MNEQTISDIIRGMQHAVNTAEDMLTAHQIEKLTESFNSDGTAKTYYIILPDGRKVDIPVACLTPSTNLSISELELEFAVKVDGTLTKGEGRDERSSYNVSFVGTDRKSIFKRRKKDRDATIRIKMKFREKDEPEAVARARELLDSTIR